MLKPSATILWPRCTQPDAPADQRQCVREGPAAAGEGEAKVVLLPPSLNDTHLLPFLKAYQKVGVYGAG